EPAALAAADGRIHGANAAWRDTVGNSPRLPKNPGTAASLFAALTAARKGESARATIRVGGADHAAWVSPAGPRRFLVRMASDVQAETLRLPSAALEVINAVAAAKSPPPKVLDAFAAASPFGAALLEGEDPFAAVIVEANPALAAVAGGQA